MVEIKDSYFLNKINLNLERQLSKKFLKKDPLICGGYLYAHLLLYHQDFSKLYFDKNDRTRLTKESLVVEGDLCHALAEDLDVFLLEDNKNFDEILSRIDLDEDCFITNPMLSEKMSLDINSIRGHYYSKFAFSIQRNISNNYLLRKIQIVRKKSQSKEKLVESFDLHNCALVWQDGKVYATDKCIESILNNEISYNENYSIPKTFFDDIFQANRIFKYWLRYEDFSNLSKSSHRRLLSLYMEMCQDHFTQARNDKNRKFIKTRYGGYMDSKLENLLNNFLRNLPYFLFKSKYMKKSDMLYLIGSDIKSISESVKMFVSKEYYFNEKPAV